MPVVVAVTMVDVSLRERYRSTGLFRAGSIRAGWVTPRASLAGRAAPFRAGLKAGKSAPAI
jgi:hypothetical protein